jgi:DNA-binding response OmpR family regulator
VSDPRPPVRALVVDDDPLMAGLLTTVLGRRGYEVQACEDGAEALERVREGGFDLVMTDRVMPGLDGLALCRAIRALPGGGRTYCILLTASDERIASAAAIDAGVDDFIAKPLDVRALAARLDAAERALLARSR